MDGKSSGGSDVSLSIDHPDKIMEIGDSIDMGKCQAKKPDGTGCTNLVNLSSCEYCIYHVKRAYKAMSTKRGEIQSAFSGNSDVRSRIMGKIDPKGES
jgi:minichromosome maintenance protein 10